jgi:Peptidase M15
MSLIYSGVLSDHFSWEEAQHSQLADRYGIDNSIPSEKIAAAVQNTASQMERVRTLLSRAILISSWYRCPDLNYKLGSKITSQHLKGEAVDFLCPLEGTPLEICKRIIAWPELISFDQLILEHTWVHISFSSDPNVKNRKEVLSLLQTGGYSTGLTDLEGKPL